MNVESLCERERLGQMQRWWQSLLIMQRAIDPSFRRLFLRLRLVSKDVFKRLGSSGPWILQTFGLKFPPAFQLSPSCFPGEETETVAGILWALLWHRSSTHCLTFRDRTLEDVCFINTPTAPALDVKQTGAIISAPIGSRALYLPFPSAVVRSSD